MPSHDPAQAAPPAVAAVRPILVGGDIGSYATARAFHEAYGVPTVVLAGVQIGAVAHSRIVDLRIHPGLDEPQRLLAVLLEVIAEQPGARHLVLGSVDWLVTALVTVREQLEAAGAVVPYPGADLLSQVGDKAALMGLADASGMARPRSVQGVPAEFGAAEPGAAAADFAAGSDGHPARMPEPPGLDLAFPVVVKPASASVAHDVQYPGKAKVHHVPDAAALRALWQTMATAGVDVPMLVQEYIAGPDSAMAAVNVFIGPDGRFHIAQFGHVLLEEHAPTAIGNSVAQLTTDPAGTQARALSQVVGLLRTIGWTGFANADLKRDVEGTYRLLEINPRVGRSGFAVTASGYNVADLYGRAYLGLPAATTMGPVREMSPDGGAPGQAVTGSDGGEPVPVAIAEHLFTVLPWPVLRRYLPGPLRATVNRVRRGGAVTNPLYYAAERNPRRLAYIAAAMVNYARKLRRYHPGR